MPIIGFDEGKNKEEVVGRNEIYTNSEVDTLLSNKVDKVTGKGLSTEDYTTTEKTLVATIENKVDKVTGKGLSTEDYTTAEKSLVATISEKQTKHTKQAITLSYSSWSNKTQTVSVTGVTASNTVFVTAAPTSIEAYSAAGIICTTQGNGTLTFTCKYTPSLNITINVVMLGV